MIKDYCKATITWKPKSVGGYGPTFGTAQTVTDVYIEPGIKLMRGVGDTTGSDAQFIIYTNLAFKVGDYVKHGDREYTVSDVNEFYKPRSVVFDHLEVGLKEVQNA